MKKTHTEPLVQTSAEDGTPAVAIGTAGSIRSSHSPMFDLIPRSGLVRLANRYEMGLIKYLRDNWKKGLNDPKWLDQLYAHTIDHLTKYNENFTTDDDNLAGAAWGIFALMEGEHLYGPRQDRRGR